MGRSVLAYQLVAGLSSVLRSKIAGMEGTFDELLIWARFEEAKICDLLLAQNSSRAPRVQTKPSNQLHLESTRNTPPDECDPESWKPGTPSNYARTEGYPTRFAVGN